MSENQEQRKILIWMLKQIYRAEKRKERLDERLMTIAQKRNAPIGGAGYDPLPRNSSTSDGAGKITLQLSEIEERIYEQKAEIDRAISRVMDILEYIPQGTLEREICEMRHIDMKSWQEIEEAIPMSRSQCNKRYNAALDILLRQDPVIRMIEESADDYYEYELNCGLREIRRNAKK